MKVGISYWGGMTANDVVGCTRLAERRGFHSAWMAEGHGGDAFAILTACALSTKRIRLGTSIVSIFVRSAPTIARSTDNGCPYPINAKWLGRGFRLR